jgi:protein-tyrosine-phosphatase/DNA-binding transcriptional ArsR family regulator
MLDGMPSSLVARARAHAALGDPLRLTIVDELAASDRTPADLRARTGLSSNLLAYHLDVLEDAGIVARCQSSGDGRRRYVCLRRGALPELPTPSLDPQAALFVCSQNSARSQLAAALWRHETGASGTSAGTHPATRVHPGAVAAAKRAGLDLAGAHPRHLTDVADRPELVVTVCDRAHEELAPPADWLHWSVPDPVEGGTRRAFDTTVRDLRDRIAALVGRPV